MSDSVKPIQAETPRQPRPSVVAGKKPLGFANRPQQAPKPAAGPSVHDVARVMTDRGGHPAVAATLLAQGPEDEQSLAMLGGIGDEFAPKELALAAQAVAELDVARQDVEDNAGASHSAEDGALSRPDAQEDVTPGPAAPGAS